MELNWSHGYSREQNTDAMAWKHLSATWRKRSMNCDDMVWFHKQRQFPGRKVFPLTPSLAVKHRSTTHSRTTGESLFIHSKSVTVSCARLCIRESGEIRSKSSHRSKDESSDRKALSKTFPQETTADIVFNASTSSSEDAVAAPYLLASLKTCPYFPVHPAQRLKISCRCDTDSRCSLYSMKKLRTNPVINLQKYIWIEARAVTLSLSVSVSRYIRVPSMYSVKVGTNVIEFSELVHSELSAMLSSRTK